MFWLYEKWRGLQHLLLENHSSDAQDSIRADQPLHCLLRAKASLMLLSNIMDYLCSDYYIHMTSLIRINQFYFDLLIIVLNPILTIRVYICKPQQFYYLLYIYINKIQCRSVCLSFCLSVCHSVILFVPLWRLYF